MANKQGRSFHSSRAWEAASPLEAIHADLCGPTQPESLIQSYYFILYTDNYSQMS